MLPRARDRWTRGSEEVISTPVRQFTRWYILYMHLAFGLFGIFGSAFGLFGIFGSGSNIITSLLLITSSGWQLQPNSNTAYILIAPVSLEHLTPPATDATPTWVEARPRGNLRVRIQFLHWW